MEKEILGLALILIRQLTKKGFSDSEIETMLENLQENSEFMDMIQLCNETMNKEKIMEDALRQIRWSEK